MSENSDTPFLPFARPSIGKAEEDEVLACLASGWLATGPRVQRFEAALSDYLGRPNVLALNSATAGLHLALLALDLQPGDEVITTPLTFVASLNTIVQAGGTPVLVDVDPDTFNIDIAAVAAVVTERTRAVMPVHFAGLPVDLAPLYALAERKSLRIVEDAAHAIGAEYDGQRIGSFGDIQVFSFHPNKNMTTGEGGAVASRDADLLHAVEVQRFHGIDRSAFNRFAKDGSPHYDVEAPGFKYNMLDLQAAIGLHQLPRLDDFIARRRAIAERYLEVLPRYEGLQLPRAPAYAHRHAWHLFTVLIGPETGLQRDDFLAAMKRRGIGIGLHYVAAHLFKFYRERFGFRAGQFPNAERIGGSIASLPLFPDMSEQDFDRVVTAMDDVLTRRNA